MKKWTIDAGTYDTCIILLVGEDKERIQSFLRKHFGCDDLVLEWDCLGLHYYCKGTKSVVWIPKRPKTEKEYATLTHELLHATFYILNNWADIPFTKDTQEAFSHLLGYLTEKCLIKFNQYDMIKRTKKSKKK